MKPKARSEHLVVEAVFDEIVVADMLRDKAHHLNEMASFVWQQCDGEKTPEQIAGLVRAKFETEQSEDLVWMSLERLDKAHLLEEKVTQGRQVITRREMLKMAAVGAALLPVIASVVAPDAAMASSHCTLSGCNTFAFSNEATFATTCNSTCGGVWFNHSPISNNDGCSTANSNLCSGLCNTLCVASGKNVLFYGVSTGSPDNGFCHCCCG